MPKISIAIPVYEMDNAIELLDRNLKSIYIQSYDDYEIVVSDDSENDQIKIWLSKIDLPIKYYRNTGPHGMANNTNNAINHSDGDLIKILFQDDMFYDSRSIENIISHFTDRTMWLVTGCTHTMDGVNFFNDHRPYYSESENTIGSPSVVTFRQAVKERFDPNFHWVLDLDFYKQLYRAYGKPKIYDQVSVIIGIGTHQTTSKLSDQRKQFEHHLLKLKYEQSTKK